MQISPKAILPSYVGWVVSSKTSMALVFEDSLFQQYNSENLTSIDNLEQLEHDEISKARFV